MPLVFAEIGKEYRILRVSGKDQMCQHLKDIGFTVNENVQLISHVNGNLIVSVRGSRIAIDRTLAMRIIVSEENI